MEVAPDNWINVGGTLGKQLRSYTERYDFTCHGLSLSLGGPSPLDETFLHKIRRFLDEHQICFFSEHLSACTDNAHMYDLMPIPFTEAAVNHVASRVMRAQEILGRQMAIENVSYYAAPGQEMDEIDFVTAVLEQADCKMLLDVNNIYVNSVNHGYDANDYLDRLPADRMSYCHIAGHYNEADDLIIDTHGADVIDPVWALLERAYQRFGVLPTLLERDFNIPAVPVLLQEVNKIAHIQDKYQGQAQTTQAQA
ncbi:MAG: UPF0276 protein [Lysobacteraceae bacterium]|nr:MAG: UPF0276 protein [Xanthomonadaceae bacterium]